MHCLYFNFKNILAVVVCCVFLVECCFVINCIVFIGIFFMKIELNKIYSYFSPVSSRLFGGSPKNVDILDASRKIGVKIEALEKQQSVLGPKKYEQQKKTIENEVKALQPHVVDFFRKAISSLGEDFGKAGSDKERSEACKIFLAKLYCLNLTLGALHAESDGLNSLIAGTEYRIEELEGRRPKLVKKTPEAWISPRSLSLGLGIFGVAALVALVARQSGLLKN